MGAAAGIYLVLPPVVPSTERCDCSCSTRAFPARRRSLLARFFFGWLLAALSVLSSAALCIAKATCAPPLLPVSEGGAVGTCVQGARGRKSTSAIVKQVVVVSN